MLLLLDFTTPTTGGGTCPDSSMSPNNQNDDCCKTNNNGTDRATLPQRNNSTTRIIPRRSQSSGQSSGHTDRCFPIVIGGNIGSTNTSSFASPRRVPRQNSSPMKIVRHYQTPGRVSKSKVQSQKEELACRDEDKKNTNHSLTDPIEQQQQSSQYYKERCCSMPTISLLSTTEEDYDNDDDEGHNENKNNKEKEHTSRRNRERNTCTMTPISSSAPLLSAKSTSGGGFGMAPPNHPKRRSSITSTSAVEVSLSSSTDHTIITQHERTVPVSTTSNCPVVVPFSPTTAAVNDFVYESPQRNDEKVYNNNNNNNNNHNNNPSPPMDTSFKFPESSIGISKSNAMKPIRISSPQKKQQRRPNYQSKTQQQKNQNEHSQDEEVVEIISNVEADADNQQQEHQCSSIVVAVTPDSSSADIIDTAMSGDKNEKMTNDWSSQNALTATPYHGQKSKIKLRIPKSRSGMGGKSTVGNVTRSNTAKELPSLDMNHDDVRSSNSFDPAVHAVEETVLAVSAPLPTDDALSNCLPSNTSITQQQQQQRSLPFTSPKEVSNVGSGRRRAKSLELSPQKVVQQTISKDESTDEDDNATTDDSSKLPLQNVKRRGRRKVDTEHIGHNDDTLENVNTDKANGRTRINSPRKKFSSSMSIVSKDSYDSVSSTMTPGSTRNKGMTTRQRRSTLSNSLVTLGNASMMNLENFVIQTPKTPSSSKPDKEHLKKVFTTWSQKNHTPLGSKDDQYDASNDSIQAFLQIRNKASSMLSTSGHRLHNNFSNHQNIRNSKVSDEKKVKNDTKDGGRFDESGQQLHESIISCDLASNCFPPLTNTKPTIDIATARTDVQRGVIKSCLVSQEKRVKSEKETAEMKKSVQFPSSIRLSNVYYEPVLLPVPENDTEDCFNTSNDTTCIVLKSDLYWSATELQVMQRSAIRNAKKFTTGFPKVVQKLEKWFQDQGTTGSIDRESKYPRKKNSRKASKVPGKFVDDIDRVVKEGKGGAGDGDDEEDEEALVSKLSSSVSSLSASFNSSFSSSESLASETEELEGSQLLLEWVQHPSSVRGLEHLVMCQSFRPRRRLEIMESILSFIERQKHQHNLCKSTVTDDDAELLRIHCRQKTRQSCLVAHQFARADAMAADLSSL